MFNRESGKIEYLELQVSGGLELEAFLSSKAGSSSQLMIDNDRWKTYRVTTDGLMFFILQFEDDRLTVVMASQALDDEEPGRWTKESEDQRKMLHDQLLLNELGSPPYRYDWGCIESVLDVRTGAGQIIVSYK